jgi:Family of unknown function (DUF5946)
MCARPCAEVVEIAQSFDASSRRRAVAPRRREAIGFRRDSTGTNVTLSGVGSACDSCGLTIAGGADGCQRLFDSIGLREYDDMRFARYHRIVVDVYAMQHPDRYGRSAKSFAAHLTGLCAWLDDEAVAPVVNAAVQRWLSGPSPVMRPALPARFGVATIAEVAAADDPVRYGEAVRRWARSTWTAYGSLHVTAREWIALARAQVVR